MDEKVNVIVSLSFGAHSVSIEANETHVRMINDILASFRCEPRRESNGLQEGSRSVSHSHSDESMLHCLYHEYVIGFFATL